MHDEHFLKIQNALRRATHEPEAAPAPLLARTAHRCEAVWAGREADDRLRRRAAHSVQEVCELAAASALGQTALRQELPLGQSVQDMIARLAASPQLRAHLPAAAEEALRAVSRPSEPQAPKAKEGLEK